MLLVAPAAGTIRARACTAYRPAGRPKSRYSPRSSVVAVTCAPAAWAVRAGASVRA